MTDTPPEVSSRWKRACWVIGAYLLLLIASLPFSVPPVPVTTAGWVTLLILAPLGYLLGEWVATKIDGNWWEGNRVLKAVKLLLFVVVGFLLIVVPALCRLVSSG